MGSLMLPRSSVVRPFVLQVWKDVLGSTKVFRHCSPYSTQAISAEENRMAEGIRKGKDKTLHRPVFVEEIVDLINPTEGQVGTISPHDII